MIGLTSGNLDKEIRKVIMTGLKGLSNQQFVIFKELLKETRSYEFLHEGMVCVDIKQFSSRINIKEDSLLKEIINIRQIKMEKVYGNMTMMSLNFLLNTFIGKEVVETQISGSIREQIKKFLESEIEKINNMTIENSKDFLEDARKKAYYIDEFIKKYENE